MDDYKRLFYMHRPDLLNSDIGSVTNRLKFKQVRLIKMSSLRSPKSIKWKIIIFLLKGPPMQTILVVPEERLPREVHLGRPKARVCIWEAQKSNLRHMSWQLAGFSLWIAKLYLCLVSCQLPPFIIEPFAERRQGLLRAGSVCVPQLHGQRSVLLILKEVSESHLW